MNIYYKNCNNEYIRVHTIEDIKNEIIEYINYLIESGVYEQSYLNDILNKSEEDIIEYYNLFVI